MPNKATPARVPKTPVKVDFDLNELLAAKRPYNPLRKTLYTPAELLAGFDPNKLHGSLDERIFLFAVHNGQNGGRVPTLKEALAQRIHDASIDAALRAYLDYGVDGLARAHKVVGIMGGHVEKRGSAAYRQSAELGSRLTRAGFHVVTGGGPGIMEAGNLGAYLADEPDEALVWALDRLANDADYSTTDHSINACYVAASVEILTRYPQGHASLAIPTWFYGREPANLFATAVAKYFSNSLREDGLISIGSYGVVFARGSAATRQEIFLNAAMNHYAEFQWCAPMVFLGTEVYGPPTHLFDLVQSTANENYKDLLLLTDSPEATVTYLRNHPPRKPKVPVQ